MASQRVIGFHYTVQDEDGEELDSSRGDEPMYILEGTGEIVPGLERAVASMRVGERRTVALKAADAYGDHDPELVMRVERAEFPPEAQLEPGDQFSAEDESEHEHTYTVVAIEDDVVVVDGNHPLAGHDLVFDVEIIESRPATKDEIAHGHAHGAHGHHH
jgi:FKBP-type peptidyl-prolyl cis-trans isomerase SlyD